MPKAFFRFFVQYQDPHKFAYIGAPKPFRCPNCSHQWFFDPVITDMSLTVRCTKCEIVFNVSELFMKDFAEL